MKDESEKSVQAILSENIPQWEALGINLASLSGKIYGAIRRKVARNVEDAINRYEHSAKELNDQAYRLRNEALFLKEKAENQQSHNKKEFDKVVCEYLKIKDVAAELHAELLLPETKPERISYIQGFLACYMSVKHEELNFIEITNRNNFITVPKYKLKNQ